MKNRDGKVLTCIYYFILLVLFTVIITINILRHSKSGVQYHKLQDQDQGQDQDQDQDQGQDQDHDQGILERQKKNSRHNVKFKLKIEDEDINSRTKGNARK